MYKHTKYDRSLLSVKNSYRSVDGGYLFKDWVILPEGGSPGGRPQNSISQSSSISPTGLYNHLICMLDQKWSNIKTFRLCIFLAITCQNDHSLSIRAAYFRSGLPDFLFYES